MNEQMRKEFEAWAKDASKGFTLYLYVAPCDSGLVYTNDLTLRMWQAWQASRAALVVELPDWFVFGIDAACYRDDVIEALNKAGVSYK